MKKVITTLAAILPLSLLAQNGPKQSELDNSTAVILVIIIAGLMMAIAMLGSVVIGAAKLYYEKFKSVENKVKNEGAKLLSVVLLLLVSSSLFAQSAPAADAAAPAANGPLIQGLSDTSSYLLITIIILELLVIIVLSVFLKKFVKFDYETEVKAASADIVYEEYREPAWKKLWNKANNFRSIQEEADLDLGHDYDGIRELDNRLPPWWLYGFYITIFFACVYLWRYQVAHSAPGSAEEYNIAVKEAAIKQEAYLAKAADKIDENSVKLLTDAADLAAGKKVFETVCAACHKPDGGGLVGPNLTDDYWLHGGSIQDIFKTIKYGWPEKGMKSWKDDYSPKQIAQIGSYVKSLHGSNPPGAKEKQGELYQEQAAAPAGAAIDSTAKQPDSTKVAKK